MESFRQAKFKWLQRRLELANGIPSVFARLNPQQLQQSFLEWVRSLVHLSGGQVIALKGNPLRQSYDTAEGKGAIHQAHGCNFVGIEPEFAQSVDKGDMEELKAVVVGRWDRWNASSMLTSGASSQALAGCSPSGELRAKWSGKLATTSVA